MITKIFSVTDVILQNLNIFFGAPSTAEEVISAKLCPTKMLYKAAVGQEAGEELQITALQAATFTGSTPGGLEGCRMRILAAKRKQRVLCLGATPADS